MRIAKVVGNVTLSRQVENMTSSSFKLVIVQSLANLTGESDELDIEQVVYDPLGAAVGQYIAMSEGGEASQPFQPTGKPVDAYCAAILDTIHVKQVK